ncbi:MAG: diacylglycerol kinase [Candidatus Kerfeldbacteria bacterium CG_4_10_14_0_8_um_filter_42_10]|uniref:Diacylglycerol kinase n=1 Tax=Candidatus Kerfeldbacteria bacterium CG_4_10_14_0_8_um_filter_42_10 TaxID=2014248 RepID=A0A2M7RKV8_9BACT|nr:MAG: diacylglycerol kinase [Candidatus Kerfeldbacteria bacterium CG_4_10_14_0_8_um_filter_42_10]
MPLINWKTLRKSFCYAGCGMRYAFKNEQSFRFQVFASVIVLILMFLFPLSAWERIVVILLIFMVLILELINTTFEKIVDILKPRVHFYAEVIKDLMAAVVLIASVGALVIGLYIFLPHFF